MQLLSRPAASLPSAPVPGFEMLGFAVRTQPNSGGLALVQLDLTNLAQT